jgi:flagellar M-ring protein FliF
LAGPGGAPAGPHALVPAGGAEATRIEDVDATIDIAHVEGRVGARLIEKAREVIDRSPDDALAILRGWLQES